MTRNLVAGRPSHQVGLVLPLEKIVDAHEAVEAGTTLGQVVLTV